MQNTIDRIYEAALFPEKWGHVLEKISNEIGAVGATLFTADASGAVRFLATDALEDTMKAFAQQGWASRNRRPIRYIERKCIGFITDYDLFEPSELHTEPLYRDFLQPRGLGWCSGTMVQAPSGENFVFNFEWRASHGPVHAGIVSYLNDLGPHLYRAALLSTRLRLEQTRTMASILDHLGFAAAVLGDRRQVICANGKFEDRSAHYFIRGRSVVELRHPSSQALFADAMRGMAQEEKPSVRSIPIPATADRTPAIAHLVPLRRDARDLFSAAAVMVLAAVEPNLAPSASLLQGLFDLSPAEARLTGRLVTGQTLASCAEAAGVSIETARSQLKSVFSKTGTHRQSELIALLGGARLG